MSKILIGGAGGAPSEGVIKSLMTAEDRQNLGGGGTEDIIIGMGSVDTDLILSSAERKYHVPYANEASYKDVLMRLLIKEKPDLIHVQNDLEVYAISKLRDAILSTGTKIFMPEHSVIETCVSKWNTYQAFKKAQLKIPNNIFIKDENDLKRAFSELGNAEGTIWLRANSIGGGGMGSIATNNYEFAKGWIDKCNGWDNFIAANLLTKETVTWLSIWYEGEVIVAQTRKRHGWIHGNRAASGVTGVTKVGITCSDEVVTKIAQKAVFAVSEKPHGIFGVDMTYDTEGIPNPTEINISRFFTTILFFTKAGLNLPKIYKDLALFGKKPDGLIKKVNPLPDGLMWLRGMDREPMLATEETIKGGIINL